MSIFGGVLKPTPCPVCRSLETDTKQTNNGPVVVTKCHRCEVRAIVAKYQRFATVEFDGGRWYFYDEDERAWFQIPELIGRTLGLS